MTVSVFYDFVDRFMRSLDLYQRNRSPVDQKRCMSLKAKICAEIQRVKKRHQNQQNPPLF